jgi:hypothetical protein
MYIKISKDRFINMSNFDMVQVKQEDSVTETGVRVTSKVATLARIGTDQTIKLTGNDVNIVEDYLLNPPNFWKR